MINDFFNWCVWVLEVIGDFTGMGYELANIVIFVILQPALILIFYILWRREKREKIDEKNRIGISSGIVVRWSG